MGVKLEGQEDIEVIRMLLMLTLDWDIVDSGCYREVFVIGVAGKRKLVGRCVHGWLEC